MPLSSAGRRPPSLAWLAPAVLLQFSVEIGPLSYLQDEAKRHYGDEGGLAWSLALSARGLLSVLCSPLLGVLADRWGRKPYQAWKAAFSIMPMVPLAVGLVGPWRVPLMLLLVGVQGLAGAQFALAISYCADLVDGGGRRLKSTIARMLSLTFTPSFILAPKVMEVISTCVGQDFMWRAVVCAGILNVLYSLLVLPESVGFRGRLPETPMSAMASHASPNFHLDEPIGCRALNPLRHLRLLSPRSPVGADVARILRLACGVIFFLYLSKMSIIAMIMIFAELRFGWHPGKTSWLLSTWGVSQFLSMSVLSMTDRGRNEPARGGTERTVAWIGLWSALVGMVLLSVMWVDWLMFPALFTGAVSMITYAALGSFCGRVTDASMNGEVQALLGIMIDLSQVLGPPVCGLLLNWGMALKHVSSFFPNLPFIVGALPVLVAAAFLHRLPTMEEAYQLGSKARAAAPPEA